MTVESPSPSDDRMCLDQFLKLSQAVDSGGRAKWLIQNGHVSVNGAVETRRRRKLAPGDVVAVNGRRLSPFQPGENSAR